MKKKRHFPWDVGFTIYILVCLVGTVIFSYLYLNDRSETNKQIHEKDTPPSTVEVGLPPVPPITPELNTSADADKKAERLNPPITIEEIDPCGPIGQAYVNNLSYHPYDSKPVVEAYRVVAKCNGWTDATIAFYEEGVVYDIIAKESISCPRIMGTQIPDENCNPPSGNGNGEDAGWCQITSSGWGSGGILRTMGFYNHPSQIVKDAWSSMDACIKLIMYNTARPGFPWTWNKGQVDDWACDMHPIPCWVWPNEWVNL